MADLTEASQSRRARPPHAARFSCRGGTLWLSRNTMVGYQRVLTSTSRSKYGPTLVRLYELSRPGRIGLVVGRVVPVGLWVGQIAGGAAGVRGEDRRGTESGTGGIGQASRWTLTRDCQLEAKTQKTIQTQPAAGRVVTRIWGAERVLTVDPGRFGDLAPDLPGNGDRFSHLSRSAYTVRIAPPMRSVTAHAGKRRLPARATQSASSLSCGGADRQTLIAARVLGGVVRPPMTPRGRLPSVLFRSRRSSPQSCG